MRPYHRLLKYHRILLVFLSSFFAAALSLQAQQCSTDVYFDVYSTGASCAPGLLTVRADLNYTDPSILRGEFRWYDSETSTSILYTSNCSGDGSSSDYQFYAEQGKTVYVCVYDYDLGCETRREPYTVSFPPPLNGYLDYARVCHDNIGEVHVALTSGSAYFELYKNVNGSYEYIATDGSGYFTVADPEVNGQYKVVIRSGGECASSIELPFSFEFNDPTAPTVVGNTTVCEGVSTVLEGRGPQNTIAALFWTISV